ncbi:MAG: hypothetical protein AABM67_21390 [Acidobacteriota bacterium]
MKAFLLVLLLSSSSVAAQELVTWYRVYTFDESVIDMNTANVILGGDIGRVTFRWTFDQPEFFLGDSHLKHKRRLETIEFKCSDQRYRYYEVSLLDLAGKTIRSELMRSPYVWNRIQPGSVVATISIPACELIAAKAYPTVRKRTVGEQIKAEKVAKFALSIRETLDRSKDFKPVIERFFTIDFIKRYVNDEDTNWFYNLNRDTAAKASPAELRRFYVAGLNAGYLTSLYVISRSSSDDDSIQADSVPEDKMIPPDVYQLIDGHAYTRTYGAKTKSYDHLTENIDSLSRMRSYTDLLEQIAVLMRKHVTRTHAERSKQYEDMLESSNLESRVCPDEYLGLPKGTKLFEIRLPPIRLQFAEIKGQLKVISARDFSR